MKIFVKLSHNCLGAFVCACTHVWNGISFMACLINIINRPINLPNESDPFIAVMETSMFEAIKHILVNQREGRRTTTASWTGAALTSESEGGSNTAGAYCWGSAFINMSETMEHKAEETEPAWIVS